MSSAREPDGILRPQDDAPVARPRPMLPLAPPVSNKVTLELPPAGIFVGAVACLFMTIACLAIVWQLRLMAAVHAASLVNGLFLLLFASVSACGLVVLVRQLPRR